MLAWKEKDRFCAFVATACTMDHYMGIYQLEDRSVKDQPLIRTVSGLCLRAAGWLSLGRCCLISCLRPTSKWTRWARVATTASPPSSRRGPPARCCLSRPSTGSTGEAAAPVCACAHGCEYARARYKFAICFENGAGPGWITEKLFDAYLGM